MKMTSDDLAYMFIMSCLVAAITFYVCMLNAHGKPLLAQTAKLEDGEISLKYCMDYDPIFTEFHGNPWYTFNFETKKREVEWFTMKEVKVPDPKKLLLNPLADPEKDVQVLWPKSTGYIIYR